MKIAIMQPYFFPYIGYFQVMNYVDVYVVYDDVNYIKNGWINRNKILINGKSSRITLSVRNSSSFKPINKTEIDDDIKNRKNIIDSIYFAYKRAPMFNDVMPLLSAIIGNPEKNLSKYLFNGLREICNYLQIDAQLLLSSDLPKNNKLKGVDKLINICHLLHAGEYINSVGGQALYNKNDFKNEGIKLSFLEPDFIAYKQFGNDFISNLSIVDVLMFNSVKDIKILLNKTKKI